MYSSSEDDSIFGSTDRSKGTTSSTLSLNERHKKGIINGSHKPDEPPPPAPPPPDITTSAVVSEAAMRKAQWDRKKQP
ncbi:unnamed protein product [Gongylonema pulchrum]|uniref:WH2 domain-containing protein n=1 Tax=Gongylonema pulchrum TaxID=637853 RepID=A0A183E7L7_9BILA|nr:unnamed protein product [Gongylonema pulchrum]